MNRFWSKVEVLDDHECWPWIAFRNPAGYGMFRFRKGDSMWLAHRVAWVLTNGEIPDGLHTLHNCDNPQCVNPAHLYLGTNADNVADKVRRRRSSFPQPKRRGELHPLAKLSDAEVSAIRAAVTGRRGERSDLARRYGVSKARITQIIGART